jgi:hypothetical protein
VRLLRPSTRQLRSAAKLKFLVDVMQVHLHRSFGQMKFVGDLLVVQTLRCELGDISFAWRQATRNLGRPFRNRELAQQVWVDPLPALMYAIHTIDEARGASPAQQNPLHAKVQQIRGCNRVVFLQQEDDRHRAVAGAEPRDRSRDFLSDNVFRQHNDVRTVGIQRAQKVSFARAPRRHTMTGRVQRSQFRLQ